MSLLGDFKSFVMKGNVMDLAVAVIIGGAFGKIVDSLVKDVVMPPIGMLTGKGFTDNFVVLKDGAKTPGPYESLDAAMKAGANVWAYGNFMTAIMNFLIIAFVVFLMIKMLTKVVPPPVEEPAGPTPTESLLTEIRDLLKK